ncbi:MAG: endopeptidase La, partial [Deltaproteobacteria bacterium]|nr:endopeptidase La [Deltaproteobacteria bacterium]
MIALNHLVPRQLIDHGLTREQLHFTEESLKEVIKGYTREAGVRNLEREIAHICRKVAKEIAEGETGPFLIKANSVEKYLGPKKFLEDEALQKSEVGVAQGLAWTNIGGVLLQIETTKVPGREGIKLTGQLGEVMRE